MTSDIKQSLKNYGYSFIPRFCEGVDTASIVTSLGVVLRLSNGPAVHQLTPKEKVNSAPNTYSGIYGTGAFPFHSDMAHWQSPPRFLMLRCVVGDASVQTLVADSHELSEQIGERLLWRAIVRPRRPVSGRLPLLRLLEKPTKLSKFRWDPLYLSPASPAGVEGMKSVNDHINLIPVEKFSLKESGDTLIVDNWRMLHSRSNVDVSNLTRVIDRVYLEEIYNG